MKGLRLKPFLGGIVVTAAIAAVAVPSALATTSSRGGSAGPVHAQQVQSSGPYIGTLPPGYTLGGAAPAAVTAHGYDANAYVPGGTTAGVAAQIQSSGRNHTPVVTDSSSGNGSNWRDIAFVALGALLLVLLLGAIRAGRDRPDARTA